MVAIKTIKYDDLFAHCAGHFLSDDLPKTWEEMSDKDRTNFLENNLWEPFYDSSADWVFEQIETMARSFASFLSERGVEVSGVPE